MNTSVALTLRWPWSLQSRTGCPATSTCFISPGVVLDYWYENHSVWKAKSSGVLISPSARSPASQTTASTSSGSSGTSLTWKEIGEERLRNGAQLARLTLKWDSGALWGCRCERGAEVQKKLEPSPYPAAQTQERWTSKLLHYHNSKCNFLHYDTALAHGKHASIRQNDIALQMLLNSMKPHSTAQHRWEVQSVEECTMAHFSTSTQCNAGDVHCSQNAKACIAKL